jgi:vacuolar-type H+-ATPase subunit H
MVQEVFKQLLEAEQSAEAIVDSAQAERDRMIATAHEEVQVAQAQFEAHLPAIRADHLQAAHERAARTISDLNRQNGESQHALRQMAQLHEQTALDAALSVLLDPDKG